MRIQPVKRVIEYPAYKQNRERETMRNYELIKAIYERCPKAENFANGGGEQLTTDQLFDRCLDVIDMIELHRPEIAGKLPTDESLMEEMRKYPHRDNHMD